MTYHLRKSDQVRYFTKAMGQPVGVEPTPELALAMRHSRIWFTHVGFSLVKDDE